MANQAPQYKRAAEFVKGIGDSLEKISGQDVLLVSYEVDDDRPMRGEPKTIVTMQLAVDPSKPDETRLYHAWSDSLAQKLADIPSDQLPLLVNFTRVPTSGGFRVWTFE